MEHRDTTTTWQAMSEDLLIISFQFLDIGTLWSASKTCKSWRNAAEAYEQKAWRLVYFNSYYRVQRTAGSSVGRSEDFKRINIDDTFGTAMREVAVKKISRKIARADWTRWPRHAKKKLEYYSDTLLDSLIHKGLLEATESWKSLSLYRWFVLDEERHCHALLGRVKTTEDIVFERGSNFQQRRLSLFQKHKLMEFAGLSPESMSDDDNDGDEKMRWLLDLLRGGTYPHDAVHVTRYKTHWADYFCGATISLVMFSRDPQVAPGFSIVSYFDIYHGDGEASGSKSMVHYGYLTEGYLAQDEPVSKKRKISKSESIEKENRIFDDLCIEDNSERGNGYNLFCDLYGIEKKSNGCGSELFHWRAGPNT